MQLSQVHHGKFNRQNKKKWVMIVNENWLYTAYHQQFDNWIKQLIGLEWNMF